jgi:hypothetical protein
MIKQLLVLIALTATSAHLAMANGHPVMQQVSKADSALYIAVNCKSSLVRVSKKYFKNDSLYLALFTFGKSVYTFAHLPNTDGRSILVADSVSKSKKIFTVDWILNLPVDEYLHYFDGSRPLYVIDLCDTIKGYTRAYPVTTSDYENCNDVVYTDVSFDSVKVGGNEPILVYGRRGLVVDKHTPYPFNHKIRGDRFTPLYDDIGNYQKNLIYRSHVDTLHLNKPLFFGAVENGRRMLYVVYLPPSQKLYYSWSKKTMNCYAKSRKAAVYEYNIDADSLTNTEFVYDCNNIKNTWHTYAYRRGSMLASKPIKQTNCFIENDYLNFKKKIIACIKSKLPLKAEYLHKKRVSIYANVLVDVKGRIVDTAIGWYDYKSVFTESDFLKIRSCFMQETIKIASPIKRGEHRYYQPVTISISPDDWYQ